MKLQKYTKFILSILFSVILSYGAISAWNGLLAEEGDTLTSSKWNEIINQISALGSNSGSPAGQVSSFATTSCPTGWLNTNGNAVSRTTYSDLHTAIGNIYGSGDGSSTFNLPDYRGYFLRGTDSGAGIDPDSTTRTNRGDGVTGDNVGTKQADEFLSHAHGVKYKGGRLASLASGTHQGSINDVYTYRGGSETRPKNINVLYCIKY